MFAGMCGVFKDRASARVQVIAALSAGISLTVCQLVKGAFNAAFLAGVTHTKANFHDMCQTGIVIGKAFKKVLNSKFFHGLSSL